MYAIFQGCDVNTFLLYAGQLMGFTTGIGLTQE